jgi:choline dehydrogenase
VVRRSTADKPVPDLFCMALLADFTGYFPGYSRQINGRSDTLTWAVLKAHTENRAGTVTLRSADPRDMPLVDFRYFEEGSDASAADLKAVVEGIRFVRRLAAPLVEAGLIAEEEKPGKAVQSDGELSAYVRDSAWGHHASCSCAIGPREAGGVLASDFRVHGTDGLRIVDASIFPRIPGFFIASAVYVAAEKAADVILAEARRGR